MTARQSPESFRLQPVCHPRAHVEVRWTRGSDLLAIHCEECHALMFRVARPIDRKSTRRDPRPRRRAR